MKVFEDQYNSKRQIPSTRYVRTRTATTQTAARFGLNDVGSGGLHGHSDPHSGLVFARCKGGKGQIPGLRTRNSQNNRV